jgi:hypothetical protein
MLMVLVAAITASCTARTGDGQGRGDQSAGIDVTPPYDSRFEDILPPRIRELNLAAVDPCTDLFTEPQLRELRYDLGYARPPLPDHSDIHGGPDCTYSSTGAAGGVDRNMVALIGISTTEGALVWITDPYRMLKSRPTVVIVAGYAAIVLPHPKFPDNCLLVVDTAEGQYLEVAVGPARGKDDTYDPYCAEAERLAGMAIGNVREAGLERSVYEEREGK